MFLGHNLFLQFDSCLWLGASIFLGILSAFCFPRLWIGRLENFGYKLTQKRKVFFGFLIFIFVGLILIQKFVLHSFMNSADEHSCYFLAKCLQRGKWWVRPHPLSEFFNVVHVGNRDGKWFSVYPYGWPLLWSFGMKLGAGDFLNPLFSVLGLFCFYQGFRKILGLGAALWAILLTATTPFFLFTGASYYSHALSFLMTGLFLYSFLEWRENSESKKWAVICALSFGYGLATRYLTMAVLGMPFLIFYLAEKIKKKEKWRIPEFLFLAISCFFVATVLFQNWAITGHLFLAPNQYDKAWEKLGFKDTYTPVDGLIFLIARFFYLMDWSAPMGVLLFFIGLYKVWQYRRWADIPLKLTLFGILFLAFGYFFYFSWGGNQYGPRYYYEGFPFYAAAVVFGFQKLWQKKEIILQKFLMGLLAAGILSQGYFLVKQMIAFEKISRQRKALYEMAESQTQKPALVFIRGFLGDELVLAEEDAVRNNPTLNGLVLYAHDLGEKNQILLQRFGGYHAYLGTYDRKHLRPVLAKL